MSAHFLPISASVGPLSPTSTHMSNAEKKRDRTGELHGRAVSQRGEEDASVRSDVKKKLNHPTAADHLDATRFAVISSPSEIPYRALLLSTPAPQELVSLSDVTSLKPLHERSFEELVEMVKASINLRFNPELLRVLQKKIEDGITADPEFLTSKDLISLLCLTQYHGKICLFNSHLYAALEAKLNALITIDSQFFSKQNFVNLCDLASHYMRGLKFNEHLWEALDAKINAQLESDPEHLNKMSYEMLFLLCGYYAIRGRIRKDLHIALDAKLKVYLDSDPEFLKKKNCGILFHLVMHYVYAEKFQYKLFEALDVTINAMLESNPDELNRLDITYLHYLVAYYGLGGRFKDQLFIAVDTKINTLLRTDPEFLNKLSWKWIFSLTRYYGLGDRFNSQLFVVLSARIQACLDSDPEFLNKQNSECLIYLIRYYLTGCARHSKLCDALDEKISGDNRFWSNLSLKELTCLYFFYRLNDRLSSHSKRELSKKICQSDLTGFCQKDLIDLFCFPPSKYAQTLIMRAIVKLPCIDLDLLLFDDMKLFVDVSKRYIIEERCSRKFSKQKKEELKEFKSKIDKQIARRHPAQKEILRLLFLVAEF